ncbi:MAG: AAA family ATPase [Candidatus Thermoplasmatota archaeon]|nr:AAA family ATPase [Candidatus Thermoplasmatota archaeon]
MTDGQSEDWTKFKGLLAKMPAVGPGARHISVEFHCHTPASDDFAPSGPEGYKGVADQLATAGVEAVFVTDHNTWEGIEPLRKAVRDRGGSTTVYPGVELTVAADAARIGDGLSKDERKIKPYAFHCLALIPPSDQALNQIESLVTNTFRNREILDLKPTDRKLVQPLPEIARAVHEWGGVLLVAHFHQGKSPAKSRSHDDVYCDELAIQHLHQYFDAVEVRDETQAVFFDGQQKGDNGQTIPEKACVLGSDGHTPPEVGVERTWVLVEANAFDDIRTSLRYRERVRFNSPIGSKDTLQHLVIDGAFLGACHFDFSPGLTSLIGTKGAGKSAVLECIRFALGVAPSVDVEKYLNHILGPSGKVWLSVRSSQDQEFLFVRSRSETAPRVVSGSGTVLERDAVIPSNFPVEIRGWGEVTKLAEDKVAQLQLLDAFDTTGTTRALAGRLRELRSELPERFKELRSTLDRLKETKTELDQLQLKKERLNKLIVGQVVEVQTAKEERDSELASYRELCRVLRENETVGFAVLSAESHEQIRSLRGALESKSLAAAVAERARAAMDKVEETEAELAGRAVEGIKGLASEVEQCILALEDQFKPLEAKYQEVFAGLDPNEQDVLLARNEIIQEIARLPAVQGRYDQLSSELERHLHAYGDRLEATQRCVNDRSEARDKVLGTLNARLGAASIGTRVKLERQGAIKGNLPSGAPAADAFGALGRQLRSMTAATALARYYDIVPVTGQRDEFTLDIDDSPAIEFELYPQVWRPSEQLSTGQKSTAVLPLIIMLGDGPVILDQPEDNLDNKYIGSTVVRMMLAEKSRRQFVVTSHNATLVVMSDSDLVVEMTDQAGKAEVVRYGFLNGPHSRVRQSVLEVLDGGEIALKRRFSKYGLAL